MVFDNFIAYCKGWYRRRKCISHKWIDIAHCVLCDGYMCYTKQDVLNYCMSRIDEYAKENPQKAYTTSFSSIYHRVQTLKKIVSMNSYSQRPVKEDIDEIDYIIWAICDFFQFTNKRDFTTFIKPSRKVLPLARSKRGETIKQREIEVDKSFPDGLEYNPEHSYYKSFQEREKAIRYRTQCIKNITKHDFT